MLAVVEKFLWPKMACTAVFSRPHSTILLLAVWRSVCGCTPSMWHYCIKARNLVATLRLSSFVPALDGISHSQPLSSIQKAMIL